MRALLAGSGTNDLIDVGMVDEVLDELGNPLVRIRHIGVGPDHDATPGLRGAYPPSGARPTIATERHQAHVRVVRQLVT